MAAAATVGCAWCMDFGYWTEHTRGLDPAKLRAVPSWRDSDVFTPQERRVLEYAEAMTSTPPRVSDPFTTDRGLLFTVAYEGVDAVSRSLFGLARK